MIIHFRRQSEAKTNSAFSVSDAHLKLTDQYVYLGMLLTEHLDYTAMAKHVSKSANRALSLIITKHKWAYRACFSNCKNWCFRVRKMFQENQI